jgi:hypothetical protein
VRYIKTSILILTAILTCGVNCFAAGWDWRCIDQEGNAICRIENVLYNTDQNTGIGSEYLRLELEREAETAGSCQTVVFRRTDMTADEFLQIEALLMTAFTAGMKMKFTTIGKFGNTGCYAEKIIIFR